MRSPIPSPVMAEVGTTGIYSWKFTFSQNKATFRPWCVWCACMCVCVCVCVYVCVCVREREAEVSVRTICRTVQLTQQQTSHGGVENKLQNTVNSCSSTPHPYFPGNPATPPPPPTYLLCKLCADLFESLIKLFFCVHLLTLEGVPHSRVGAATPVKETVNLFKGKNPHTYIHVYQHKYVVKGLIKHDHVICLIKSFS